MKQIRGHDGVGRQAAEGAEQENARLKKVLAEALLEQAVTQEVLRKKWWPRPATGDSH